LRPLDAQAMRELLESLFSEHTASLRDDMRRELQRFSAAAATTPAPPPPPVREQRDTAPPHASRVLRVASVLLLVACGALGYLYYETRSALDEANERTRRLADGIAAIGDVRPAAAASSKPVPVPETNGVLEVLEWGINRGGRYAFDALPLDDERATVLTALLAELEEIGFEGTVAVDVHVGRFCMNYGADGVLELAPAAQPAAQCDQVGWPEGEAVTRGQRESLAYANLVTSLTAHNPRLRIESASHGSTAPAAPYPRAGELTAGAWNAVAAINNRVSVQLLAD